MLFLLSEVTSKSQIKCERCAVVVEMLCTLKCVVVFEFGPDGLELESALNTTSWTFRSLAPF